MSAQEHLSIEGEPHQGDQKQGIEVEQYQSVPSDIWVSL
jgi:hypothetical protein